MRAIYQRNRDANRPVSFYLCRNRLSNCTHPVYLGVIQDCSITFKSIFAKPGPKKALVTTFFISSLFILSMLILYLRESELYRYILNGTSALAWELPLPRFLSHMSSTLYSLLMTTISINKYAFPV